MAKEAEYQAQSTAHWRMTDATQDELTDAHQKFLSRLEEVDPALAHAMTQLEPRQGPTQERSQCPQGNEPAMLDGELNPQSMAGKLFEIHASLSWELKAQAGEYLANLTGAHMTGQIRARVEELPGGPWSTGEMLRDRARKAQDQLVENLSMHHAAYFGQAADGLGPLAQDISMATGPDAPPGMAEEIEHRLELKGKRWNGDLPGLAGETIFEAVQALRDRWSKLHLNHAALQVASELASQPHEWAREQLRAGIRGDDLLWIAETGVSQELTIQQALMNGNLNLFVDTMDGATEVTRAAESLGMPTTGP